MRNMMLFTLLACCAGLLSVKNCLARFFGSLVYVITLSFLAALLPDALPNVASVIGAVCYISLVRPVISPAVGNSKPFDRCQMVIQMPGGAANCGVRRRRCMCFLEARSICGAGPAHLAAHGHQRIGLRLKSAVQSYISVVIFHRTWSSRCSWASAPARRGRSSDSCTFASHYGPFQFTCTGCGHPAAHGHQRPPGGAIQKMHAHRGLGAVDKPRHLRRDRLGIRPRDARAGAAVLRERVRLRVSAAARSMWQRAGFRDVHLRVPSLRGFFSPASNGTK